VGIDGKRLDLFFHSFCFLVNVRGSMNQTFFSL